MTTKPEPLKGKWSSEEILIRLIKSIKEYEKALDTTLRIKMIREVEESLKKLRDTRSAVEAAWNEIKSHPTLVNENDLQNMECIELSTDGYLIPTEQVWYILQDNFEDVMKDDK